MDELSEPWLPLCGGRLTLKRRAALGNVASNRLFRVRQRGGAASWLVPLVLVGWQCALCMVIFHTDVACKAVVLDARKTCADALADAQQLDDNLLGCQCDIGDKLGFAWWCLGFACIAFIVTL